MELKTKILEMLEKIPLCLQKELLHYEKYHQEKYHQENLIQDNSTIRSQIDRLKHICDESFNNIKEIFFLSWFMTG
ncbi:hypothetical protein GM3708_1527 [Geminocystis sp. NIES-3708]|uniref:hypothetical protein n=1 Tax=Geminocystis sp. NIES-3708 TaxID=1615909 RepID=UPI0005FCA96B|nr:hypothetical protein [Geminocystis sp. NIES-3708]BAQ61121.1 hypothetical protein GM3708_1527 [Geminocystis sp. NIES-3708]